MIELIEKTIQMLRERVQANLSQIKENQGRIRNILQEPISDQRTGKFDNHYSNSKQLLKENQDLINLQINLVNFLEKYRKMIGTQDVQASQSAASPIARPSINTEPQNRLQASRDQKQPTPSETIDVADIFEKTISGKIPWTRNHPMFKNEDFFQQLMEYYIGQEDYETCGKLSRIKNS
jgi:hypothetical protein